MAIDMDNRAELMFLGRECKHPSCHLHDFLPFSCPACHQEYCQPHFLPSQHACTSPLPPSMIDRIAPQCPMCNEVVPTIPNAGPNEAVDRHIMRGTCSSMEGGEAKKRAELKRRKAKGEVCFRRGCVQVLVVPIKCDSCKHLFCPTHRSSVTHSCSPNATPSGSGTSTPIPLPQASKAGLSRLIPQKSASTSVKISSTAPAPVSASPSAPSVPLDARAAAAAAAMKRAGQQVKAPLVKHKVDKRANAEVHSQIQALKARHEKGLLSKTEELKYAELVGHKESSRRKGSKGDKDGCVIN